MPPPAPRRRWATSPPVAPWLACFGDRHSRGDMRGGRRFSSAPGWLRGWICPVR
jgi:hypothetical protein